MNFSLIQTGDSITRKSKNSFLIDKCLKTGSDFFFNTRFLIKIGRIIAIAFQGFLLSLPEKILKKNQQH